MKRVQDVMLSLTDVPAVSADATLADAVRTLREAQATRPDGRPPYRLVLVHDRAGRVAGKLGHFAFLAALQPGATASPEYGALDRAGVPLDLIDSLTRHMRLLHGDFGDCCRRAAALKVSDAMQPVTVSVEVTANLSEGVSALLAAGSQSILVRRGSEIVGVLRLADVFNVVADEILRQADAGDEGE
jgi:CBS domain-containing protein